MMLTWFERGGFGRSWLEPDTFVCSWANDRPRPGPSLIAVMLELTGSWTGTVQLQRSSDGGATRQDVTMGGGQWGNYAANACEPVWDESELGAQLYLDIALDSGTLNYRVSQ